MHGADSFFMKRTLWIAGPVIVVTAFGYFCLMSGTHLVPEIPTKQSSLSSSDEGQIGIRGSDYDRLATLEMILGSKNDNDPRLDSGFNDLTAGEKKLFRRKYGALRPELRNERGTIVYLLG